MEGLTLPLPSLCRRLLLPLRLLRPSRIPSSRDPPPELDHWDRMDLKFGRLLGEDPNLTLSKVMARKTNPDASFLDVEKSLNRKKSRKKGQPADDEPPIEVPLGWKENPHPPDRPTSISPVSKEKEIKSVALRKPAHLPGDELDVERSSRKKIAPNLVLKMRRDDGLDRKRDVVLLKKPEVVKAPEDGPIKGDDMIVSENDGPSSVKENDVLVGRKRIELVARPAVAVEKGDGEVGTVEESVVSADDGIGSYSIEENFLKSSEDDAVTSESMDLSTKVNPGNLPAQAALLGKPPRLDIPTPKTSALEESILSNNSKDAVPELPVTSEQGNFEEHEENDWRRAGELFRTGEREEVELVSCSSRGFVVSFGSLVGFLPYRNLGARWKFLAFESWLRKNGLDPSLYRQNLSIVRNYAVQKDDSLKENETAELEKKDEGKINPGMKFEELLEIYDREKIKFLSSFIGQRIRASVVLVDRDSRKILFSGRPKEKEEVLERKRRLMAKLSVGDIVKCCIRKITYFGIFVEVEGVPALIHQSEVSWDIALDPSSFFKIGQIVDAKVHQLDYALERITLSLKDITPDPLSEVLESVVGESSPLGTSFEASEEDTEWADVQSLIKELEQIVGITAVSKGRFFLSPGLAPTFQVYMGSMFDNQYKLLARYENKVQEVIVQSSLDKEQMKAAILTCTNRV